AVALAADVDDVGVVEQAVEDGACDHRVAAEDLAPGTEAFVAGQDDAATFVAARDHLEEQIALELVERTPSPNWSGHLGEVMLNLFEEEENGGISQGRRWAPAVHDRLQEGADRPRPPGRDYAFGACA